MTYWGDYSSARGIGNCFGLVGTGGLGWVSMEGASRDGGAGFGFRGVWGARSGWMLHWGSGELR